MAKMFDLRAKSYDAIEVTVAGSAVVAGEFAVWNDALGFYLVDAAVGDKAAFITRADRVEVQKKSAEVWAPGETIYWDPAGPNLATNIAGALDIIGHVVEAAATTTTTGVIALDGRAEFLKT